MTKNELLKHSKKQLVLMILSTERDNKTKFMVDSRYKYENHPTMREDRDKLSIEIKELREEIK